MTGPGERPDGERVDFVVGADTDAAMDGPPSAAVPDSPLEAIDDGPVRPGALRVRVEAVAAVIVLAAVVTAVALHGRSQTPRASTVTPSATRVTVPSRPTAAIPVAAEPLVPACPPANDGAPACIRADDVPRAFTKAVHEQFPDVRQVSTVTQRLRDAGQFTPGLWSRVYVATGRGTTVTIVVVRGHRRTVVLAPTRRDSAATEVSFGSVDGFTVQIQVERSRDVTYLRGLDALASDARLVGV